MNHATRVQQSREGGRRLAEEFSHVFPEMINECFDSDQGNAIRCRLGAIKVTSLFELSVISVRVAVSLTVKWNT